MLVFVPRYDELETYSKLTGIPTADLINQAIAEYIEVVVSTRTESLLPAYEA
jgi:Ribbon-helix-helix domain